MCDILFINELKLQATIGAYAWEQQVKQTLVLDLELKTDVAKVASTDRLNDTVDYANLTQRIIEATAASHFQLIESLAEFIAGLIINEFAISWLRLKLYKKGALLHAKEVGIIIERMARE